jgi:YgjP-like, metallopeptidase domain
VRRVSRRSAGLLFSTPRVQPDHSLLMARLREDADRIARQFHLTYRALTPERPNVKRRYGVCTADGRIAVRLKHARTGKALKYSSLINTVCHELAHLRHFNHGPRFKAFYFQILEHARRQGIYRPGAAARTEGTQMSLFGAEAFSPAGKTRRSED